MLGAREMQKGGVDALARPSFDFRPMNSSLFSLAPTTAGRVRLSLNQPQESQTRSTHMCEEHISPNASALGSTHVSLECEGRSRMYDFWLGVLVSLAVLIVTLTYRSHIGGDICGTSMLHDISSPRSLWCFDTSARAHAVELCAPVIG